MSRPKGSKDLKPRTRRVSATTRKAIDQAEADMSNGVNANAARDAIDAWFVEDDILARYQDEYRVRCNGPREQQKRILEEAKSRGVPIRALKAEIKLQSLDRKKARIVGNLEDDDRELLEQLKASLGEFADLPLGQAAMSAAERGARALGILGASQFEIEGGVRVRLPADGRWDFEHKPKAAE